MTDSMTKDDVLSALGEISQHFENCTKATYGGSYERFHRWMNAADWAAAYLNDPAPTIGGWTSVEDRLPENQVTVLIVKQLKSGQRQIGLGYCIREYKHHNYVTGEDRIEPYWVCGGNNNVIFWQDLPKIPKD